VLPHGTPYFIKKRKKNCKIRRTKKEKRNEASSSAIRRSGVDVAAVKWASVRVDSAGQIWS